MGDAAAELAAIRAESEALRLELGMADAAQGAEPVVAAPAAPVAAVDPSRFTHRMGCVSTRPRGSFLWPEPRWRSSCVCRLVGTALSTCLLLRARHGQRCTHGLRLTRCVHVAQDLRWQLRDGQVGGGRVSGTSSIATSQPSAHRNFRSTGVLEQLFGTGTCAAVAPILRS